jgi:hypothetical protein
VGQEQNHQKRNLSRIETKITNKRDSWRDQIKRDTLDLEGTKSRDTLNLYKTNQERCTQSWRKLSLFFNY